MFVTVATEDASGIALHSLTREMRGMEWQKRFRNGRKIGLLNPRNVLDWHRPKRQSREAGERS